MLRGSALELPIASSSVHCVVTSPPYWGLRSYGDDGDEIGSDSLEAYLEDMLRVGREVHRVLRDDGVFWLNIGDTASGSGGAGGDYNRNGRKQGKRRYRQGGSGLPKGTWAGVPHRVALSYISDGWLLRSAIVWDKGRLRPEAAAHVRRPRLQHEYIFMLTKTMKYRYNHEYEVQPGDVWHFPPAQVKSGSPAPFPLELPRRCIELSTLPGDTVLDPFAGSGTTLLAADSLGCHAIGVDLYGATFT